MHVNNLFKCKLWYFCSKSLVSLVMWFVGCGELLRGFELLNILKRYRLYVDVRIVAERTGCRHHSTMRSLDAVVAFVLGGCDCSHGIRHTGVN